MSYATNGRGPLPRYQTGQPISVVLICRNKARDLPVVIAALARNTQRPDLVVLSDDASTDRSPEVFAQLCEAHGLAHTVIAHEQNKVSFRLNTLRNDGVRACHDGLVIILDADHVPARTHIEAHRDLHLQRCCGVLSTGPRLEYANADCSGPINFMWGHESISMLQPSPDEPVFTWTTILVSNLGITKQAIQEIGWFDPIYDGNYGFDDVDFTYRAWQQGYFFAASFEAHVIHIPHSTFNNRNGNLNREKFNQKYNFELSYPPIVSSMARATWSNYYPYLLSRHANRAADGPLVVQMLDLKNISGKYLLKVVLGRMLRKIGRILRLR